MQTKNIERYKTNAVQITEYCPHCDSEQTVFWSVQKDGYEIFCPTCGEKIMLCSMCPNTNRCNWTAEHKCSMHKDWVKNHGWVETDNDCGQHRKELNDGTFSFVQIVNLNEEYSVSKATVEPQKLSEDDLNTLLKAYGFSNLDDFVKNNVPDWDFTFCEDGSIDRENSPSWVIDWALIAEMQFEEISLSNLLSRRFKTFEDAYDSLKFLMD